MVLSARWVGVAVAAALLVTGCGSTGGGGMPSDSPSASPTGPQTYTDPTYGFSFRYEPPMVRNENASMQTSAGSAPATTVSLMDETGPKVKEQLADGWSVSVFPLAVPVTSQNLAIAERELRQNVIPALEQDGLTVRGVTKATVAHSPAYVVTATFTVGKAPLRTTLTFVLVGDTQYQILAQATSDTWAKLRPTFEEMTGSFTIPDEPAPSDSGSAGSSPSG